MSASGPRRRSHANIAPVADLRQTGPATARRWRLAIRLRAPLMPRLHDLRPALLSAAPNTLAVLTAAAGGMLVASGATPSDPQRLMWLAGRTPIPLFEGRHFCSSIPGLGLGMLAFGLSRPLDGG